MKNFKQRVGRLEKKLGTKDDRLILIITCADPEEFPEDSNFKKDEILPGVLCFVYGKPLSNEERTQLQAEYADRAAEVKP